MITVDLGTDAVSVASRQRIEVKAEVAAPAVQVLRVAPMGAVRKSLLTTKGDLLSHDASQEVRVPVGEDGQMLTSDTAAAAGAAWTDPPSGGGGGGQPLVSMSSLGYLFGGGYSAQYGTHDLTTTLTVNTYNLVPFVIPEPLTVWGVMLNVKAPTAGSSAMVGVYGTREGGSLPSPSKTQRDLRLDPGPLLIDFGSFTGDAAADVHLDLASPVTLEPGQYWLALLPPSGVAAPKVKSPPTGAVPVIPGSQNASFTYVTRMGIYSAGGDTALRPEIATSIIQGSTSNSQSGIWFVLKGWRS